MQLFSDQEFAERFLQALGELASMDFAFTVTHEERESTGPRMSGIANCARQQYYTIIDAPRTDPSNPEGAWPNLLGLSGQALAALVLQKMGYELLDQEKTLTIDDLITGHVDGMLTGLDLGEEKAVWDAKLRNIWGLFGTQSSYGLLTASFPEADPSIYLQLQMYMAAEGVDLAIVTVHPFDLSAARLEGAKKKVERSTAAVSRILIPADADAQQLGMNRAKMIIAAGRMGITPSREFNPFDANDAKFPCGYCEWKSRCMLEADDRSFVVVPIPSEWK